MCVLSLFKMLPNFLHYAKTISGMPIVAGIGLLLCRTGAVVIAISSSVDVLHVFT
jgi:hypothetical protein